ncbi:FAD-dependent oxidoreductase [Palleronia abyssalis]|uniref:3-oxosteroid 1-dehydrogenase n=1 Tax=Palleronia abyssalis TaxID=1501240 RepID=A0A2R8C0V8_9RHOB|nr:FAD-dependent oxidoreductase [Palleronia abyssalis]SPJ26048.1 3-oxosteroid 1-dehydrogenase [Palleronia abyssalis]
MTTKSACTVDVLVIGSGGAGLTAAATARKAGLDVLVAEKEPVFGGTTATSGGVIWIPGNRHAAKLGDSIGVSDTTDAARTYIRIEAGQHVDEPRIEAYLKYGPVMVDFIEAQTEVKFHAMEFPDYHPEEPGASKIRSLGTVEYDARKMGPLMKTLKGELPQTLFLGLALGSSLEMENFMKAGRSVKAMGFVAKRMVGHFRDLALHRSSQSIVRGRALIARLARTLHDDGVPFWLESPARELILDGDKIVGARLETPDGTVEVRARHGVVLAGGGYPRDMARRRDHHPGVTATMEPVLPVPMGNTGDGAQMAEAVGARFNGNLSSAAAWMPTSKLPDATDFTGVWPHLVDRNKPGFIMVTPDGRRFANESENYRDLGLDMIATFEARETDTCWLIGDRRAVRRWGMGFVRPFPIPHGHYVRSGYLKRGETLEDLAGICGIDPVELASTVKRFNGFAKAGVDADFQRGASAYDKHHGDEENTPNPALGTLDTGPYYAVRIYPGEITSYKGLATDANARVLGHDDQPIDGLYAVGNDQANVFGGGYPGAGGTIGPGMVFGWIAAKHIAEKSGRTLPGVPADKPGLAAE